MTREGIRQRVQRMKLEGPQMAATSASQRNDALRRVKAALLARKDEIFAANAEDLVAAERQGMDPAVVLRLRFDEHKLADVCAGIDGLLGLPDPVGRVLLDRELDAGLELRRVSVPIGVIGVMFEARPDALVQISALCIKSGNVAILKGGSETARSNRALFALIHEAAVAAGLPEHCLALAESHAQVDELLGCVGLVDLLIPRGSNAFVRHIMENTRIPVMGHSDGICHVYVDAAADLGKAVPICVDAKVQYAAACNAVETLLIHQDVAERALPVLKEAFDREGVELLGDERTRKIIDCGAATEADWDREYLALRLSIRVVDSLGEAIDHINRHGSHHTDAIITEDEAAAQTFLRLVDSAGVYHNASTRFADGFRYGFGAEVGISTGKLHARGPVGLEGLMTYKYQLRGSGQVVGDYARGASAFHFRDLPTQA
ncbi:glutamate-5-semialdehyde dehydrogenase [Olsenella sp. HMSC062G07]|uniref:glutamate-5-semialdehyde dehydrogenase n=1 Tax=Olsenella sp. HMSC062G07 TaxID=1739330 RepID=UPI0008A173C0|nr:glutamate-5-semialdehyde dehydrogenase [Olsenella sp. HMSC062G07]OFK22371.1 gamma-glutamyl-phosphate reductase [Olsenella sp. HMSC062G07]